MHILDICQNSIRANAKDIWIDIEENPNTDQYLIRITDNGCGMSKEKLEQATDPFYTSRTTRKVGLGLPLLKQNTENAGGSFSIQSETGQGTRIEATFGFHHIDRPVLGDITGSLLVLFTSSEEISFHYSHTTPEGNFTVHSSEIREMLGEVPISHPDVRSFLTNYLSDNLNQIQISE